MKPHPAANIFPMMAGDELQALADDIKANGLRHPITKTTDGQLLDGRNRAAACKLAGIEPEYESYDGDALTLVVSENVRHRHLGASQKAIAAAEAVIINNDLSYDAAAKMFGTSQGYVSKAAALIANAPDLAEKVKLGLCSLTAMTAVQDQREKDEKKAAKDREAQAVQRARLQTEHADLFEQVEQGDLEFLDAMAQVLQREEEQAAEAADEAHSRRCLTEALSEAVVLLQLNTSDESVASNFERIDPAYLHEIWSPTTVAGAAEYLTKFSRLMKETK
jgi:ParB-like chromosome segregation protein Spo0J